MNLYASYAKIVRLMLLMLDHSDHVMFFLETSFIRQTVLAQ